MQPEEHNRNLPNWRGVPHPERVILEGKYTRLEPVDASKHGEDLYFSAKQPGADERFRYLFDDPPANLDDMRSWLTKASTSNDPLFFAVIDKQTGRAQGRQALMRIETIHGVIEMGHILWGPELARTRAATEAFYLFANYVFETLGYRRLEWKCHELNYPSKKAALRFGFKFEGVFRQHMVSKGANRDTAWYALLDKEWFHLKAEYEHWLQPDNFNSQGIQKKKLNCQ